MLVVLSLKSGRRKECLSLHILNVVREVLVNTGSKTSKEKRKILISNKENCHNLLAR